MTRSNTPRHIYTINISGELEEFLHYHRQYARHEITDTQHEVYLSSLVEQMIAHFDIQNVAVQSFMAHYTSMIVEGVAANWMHHPLRYLKDMDIDGYHNYVFCLYGLAEKIYGRFVEHHIFTPQGRLLAGFESLSQGTLYLVIRPEIPDDLFS